MKHIAICLICLVMGGLVCGCMSNNEIQNQVPNNSVHDNIQDHYTTHINKTANHINKTMNTVNTSMVANKNKKENNSLENHTLTLKTEGINRSANLWNALKNYPVKNITITEENNTVDIGVLIESSISNTTAEKLACDAVRLAMMKYENITTPGGTEVGKSKYNYIVFVLYPNGTAAISGAKSANSESLVFGEGIFAEIQKFSK